MNASVISLITVFKVYQNKHLLYINDLMINTLYTNITKTMIFPSAFIIINEMLMNLFPQFQHWSFE